MGSSDFYSQPKLPPEAYIADKQPLEVNDDWLKDASEELQIEAMRQWFHARFEDPANQTPYCGADGGYLFIHGGPYDPNEEIQERFDQIVPFGTMDSLIKDLYLETGDEWAPIESDWEPESWDEALAMLVGHRTAPYTMLMEQLEQIKEVLTVAGSPRSKQLTIQLAHGATITALESYLWDTATYWSKNDRSVLRSFVQSNEEFKRANISVASIFTEIEKIDDKLISYLQDQIWHRLDKVKPMLESGLGIKIPKIGDLMKQILIRHDIIHRGGRNKKGESIAVTVEQVEKLIGEVTVFADEIEEELKKRFPSTPIEDSDF
ncbi:hypothetical protein ACWKWZ_11560 [Metapseudomonas otitidis]